MHKLLPILLTTLLTAGCLGTGGPAGSATTDPAAYVLAFSVKGDFDEFVAKTQPLADWIADQTGKPTTILAVEDESASTLAVASGQAHAAFMDGGAAWIAWNTFGMEAIAADQQSNGATSYTATAWVRADSGIGTIEDLRGKRSCHTGELKSAGMLVPMGYLIGNGHIDMTGLDLDDIASLQEARKRFFSESTIGGDYVGALQCLSTGAGDVAFVKESTWDDYCGKAEAPAWCLPRETFRTLPEGGFAQVPSHPVMVSKDLSAQHREALLDALLALNEDAAGRAILKDVLKTPGITAVTTEEHLGSYGEALRHVPGIASYLSQQKLK